MAKRLLTDRTLKALEPAPAGKRFEIMDAVVPGFGVRVTDKADAKGKASQITFILVARFPGYDNPARRAIGEYGKLSLEQARDKAREWHELIRKGIDPKHKEEKEREVEQERRDNTFGYVAEEFIKRHLNGTRRAKVSEREIRTELLGQKWDRKSRQWVSRENSKDPRWKKPRWKDRPIIALTKTDVVAMVDSIVDSGFKRHAHNVLGHARTIFNWAINRGIYGLELSPCDRLKPSALIGEKATRQRVLNDLEISSVVKGAKAMNYPYGPLVQLLLLTGQRKAEVAEASWKEFDLEKKLWTIPQERFKSDSEHFVPLSKEAMAVLATLPRFESGDYLFSLTAGKSPINGFSKAKIQLDASIAARAKKIEPWVLHDLRRTVRTQLSGLRIAEPVAEMVIGHARKGLARVYDQHQYLDEMREALDQWAAKLRDIVEPAPENVVKFQTGESARA
jgi:integrase